MTRAWLSSLLWRCRWYRRRVMKRSGVWTALMQKPLTLADVERLRTADPGVWNVCDTYDGPPLVQRMREFYTKPRTLDEITRDVERELETPAILARGPRSFLEPRTENLSRRAGSWPIWTAGAEREYFCEHCPSVGWCSVCGQTHKGPKGAV